MVRSFAHICACTALIYCLAAASARAADPWVTYTGAASNDTAGPGAGKHIVLISGDEEYRSEEALPQLAKILAKGHGFKCTVLFAIDPETGEINPDILTNIPGLEALDTADCMIIMTRFRDLPDDQMQHIVDYLNAGKPVIGLRTATHAFNIKDTSKKFAKYSYNNKEADYAKGFGGQILGETWVNHHGAHGKQSTRALDAPGAETSPILRGIPSGSIWVPTDVYGAHPPEDVKPLLLGQVLDGMTQDAKPPEGKAPEKNDPMMPIAWTRMYNAPDALSADSAGKPAKSGRAFCTTMGSSQDLENESLRRLLVNATYWAVGLEDKIPASAKVDLIGDYQPHPFKTKGYTKGVKPSDLKMD
jgi:hypothetical protein